MQYHANQLSSFVLAYIPEEDYKYICSRLQRFERCMAFNWRLSLPHCESNLLS
jgi:hypothetical protein